MESQFLVHNIENVQMFNFKILFIHLGFTILQTNCIIFHA